MYACVCVVDEDATRVQSKQNCDENIMNKSVIETYLFLSSCITNTLLWTKELYASVRQCRIQNKETTTTFIFYVLHCDNYRMRQNHYNKMCCRLSLYILSFCCMHNRWWWFTIRRQCGESVWVLSTALIRTRCLRLLMHLRQCHFQNNESANVCVLVIN